MTERASSSVVAEMVGVTRTYKMGDTLVHALADFSFRFGQGEYWAVMGSSGSGKSTLLNLLGCIDRPSEGVLEDLYVRLQGVPTILARSRDALLKPAE